MAGDGADGEGGALASLAAAARGDGSPTSQLALLDDDVDAAGLDELDAEMEEFLSSPAVVHIRRTLSEPVAPPPPQLTPQQLSRALSAMPGYLGLGEEDMTGAPQRSSLALPATRPSACVRP